MVGMKIPFSKEEFLDVFEKYNQSIWPVQVLFYFLALTALIAIWKNHKNSSRLALFIVSFFWIWMGLVYHLIYFSSINQAASIFGVAFIVQGLLFLYFGVIRKSIQLKASLRLSGVVAVIFFTYSLIIYPLLGVFTGHVYPRAPTFGVPCPTTIFTFGLLLYSINRIPWVLVLVPLLWTIIGFSAAVNLSMKEDIGLVISGGIFLIILFMNKLKPAIIS